MDNLTLIGDPIGPGESPSVSVLTVLSGSAPIDHKGQALMIRLWLEANLPAQTLAAMRDELGNGGGS